MSVKERLKDYIRSQNLSVSAFERSIEASNGYVNSISKGIGADKSLIINREYSNLNMEWLLTGKGDMLKEESAVYGDKPESKNETNTPKGVPYYDLEFTASFVEVENNQQALPDHYVTHPFFAGCDFIVRASGQSMAKIIKHGDAIGLIRIESWQDFIPLGEIYAIVTKNGFRMIKIITKGDDKDSYTLLSKPSDNKKDEFPPQQIRKDLILTIYKVQASSHLF